MWVFKVLFGYDRTPNKSVEPHFGSTNTDCTGQTDRRFLREKPEFLSAKGTTKKADAFVFFVYPNSAPKKLFKKKYAHRKSNPGLTRGRGVFYH